MREYLYSRIEGRNIRLNKSDNEFYSQAEERQYVTINLMTIKAGYEYLLAYKITIPIYDYTVEFCRRWISYKSRTKDQMEQAGRSGMANIPEGYKEQSLKGYIKLSGVARGSLEELLKDYLSFARQNHLGEY